jgi:hypothetical protein
VYSDASNSGWPTTGWLDVFRNDDVCIQTSARRKEKKQKEKPHTLRSSAQCATGTSGDDVEKEKWSAAGFKFAQGVTEHDASP